MSKSIIISDVLSPAFDPRESVHAEHTKGAERIINPSAPFVRHAINRGGHDNDNDADDVAPKITLLLQYRNDSHDPFFILYFTSKTIQVKTGSPTDRIAVKGYVFNKISLY